jgi:hypothetical protein
VTTRADRLEVVSGQAPRRRSINRALAYKVCGHGEVEVYDLDFAAYCSMRGLVIADMVETGPPVRQGRRGSGGPVQYLFIFKDEEGQIAGLSVDYTNSESARHADAVRRLKKAIRSTAPKEG